jgi:hypothetical protein
VSQAYCSKSVSVEVAHVTGDKARNAWPVSAY